ncbi:hypothetical protein C9J48_17705 [Photobacterium profundum]|uniref:Putative glycosyltransferase n=1 Tax=Photobacterium profundum 3TCK TaxID=314280 RepID=Q1Z870_9GAMM|nr:glycosyltransferase [Photobacterium profundum]EAS44643.1 putative glycosyltransferase [Photobacterium profundum 3TCK]PSV60635.1 hypothetical protein C9J48_17705 [Photobacterium profundum]
MKIIYLINSFGTGGAEKQVFSLCNEMHKGNQVLLIRLKDDPSDLVQCLDRIDVKTISLNMNTIKGLLLFFFSLAKEIKAFSPDVIHAHLPHSIIVARLYKLIFNSSVRLISTAHTSNIGSKHFKMLYKMTERYSDLNTNVSKLALNRYVDSGIFNGNKSFSVPNGFHIPDVDKYDRRELRKEIVERYAFNDNDFICLAISRLAKVKNHEFMIKSIKKALNDNKTIRLLILGDGPELKNIKKMISELDVGNNVKLVGNVTDIYRYSLACDLYLMSSTYEGMPLTICEAMLSNLPILTTQFDGYEEFICDFYPSVAQGDLEKYSKFINEFSLGMYRDNINIAKENVQNKYDIRSISKYWLTKFYQKECSNE